MVRSHGKRAGTSSVSDFEADSVDTDKATINQVAARGSSSTDQTIPTNTKTRANLDKTEHEDTNAIAVDTSNDKLIAKVDGTFMITAAVRWKASSNWNTGDLLTLRVEVDGNRIALKQEQHVGEKEIEHQTISIVQELTTNDDIEMFVKHNRGGDESLDAFNACHYLQAVVVG